MKWMMLMVMALCLLAALAYGAYLKRDTVAVWLGLGRGQAELSKTPLFKPMERFVISLEGVTARLSGAGAGAGDPQSRSCQAG
ncbi:hypothetical protein [Aeromonas molluscorum]|uniref:hypothetical protein n=1 Tax=Aeromonas molluscorum TaxID=271417 RepID=UPI003F19627A